MYKSININEIASFRKVFLNKPIFKLLGILSILTLIKMVIFSQFELDSDEAHY